MHEQTSQPIPQEIPEPIHQEIPQPIHQEKPQVIPQEKPHQMKRCSMCKSLRVTPKDFIRRNKQYKTCNFCSQRVCKKNRCENDNECDDTTVGENTDDEITVAQCLNKFFACFDTSNLDEGDLEDYNRLKYMFESIQMNQKSLLKDVVEFVNDCNDTHVHGIEY